MFGKKLVWFWARKKSKAQREEELFAYMVKGALITAVILQATGTDVKDYYNELVAEKAEELGLKPAAAN